MSVLRQVIFAPRQPGIYLLQLHLVANLIVSDAPLQSGCGPNVVSVQAIAEMPQIQVRRQTSTSGVYIITFFGGVSEEGF